MVNAGHELTTSPLRGDSSTTEPLRQGGSQNQCVMSCLIILGHFLFFFLCFASAQNCKTYPPARGKNKQALKTKLPWYAVWT
jgi:hypothetical protein